MGWRAETRPAPYGARRWRELCHRWILYTFVYFVFFTCVLSAVAINYGGGGGGDGCEAGTQIFGITGLLFGVTLAAKWSLLYQRGRASTTTSLLTLVVYLYGLATHAMLYSTPSLFMIRSRLSGRCIPTIEFLQWQVTCPLLYLALMSSADFKTEASARLVLLEHLSVVASAASVAAPNGAVHIVAVATCTALSYCAKYRMARLFIPARRPLDVEIFPLIVSICVLYAAFPVTYALGVAGWIDDAAQICLFALDDVIIKVLYAAVMEFTDTHVQVLRVEDVADMRCKETVEKLFMRFIFHEIRNPLSSLSSAIDDLADRGESANDPSVESFREGVRSLSRLLDDMKELIEIQDGRTVLHESKGFVPNVVANAIVRAHPACGAGVRVECPETLPAMSLDEYRLSQLALSCVFHCLQRREDGAPIVVTIEVEGIFGDVYCLRFVFSYTAARHSRIKPDQSHLVQLRPHTVPSDLGIEYSFGIKLAEYIANMHGGDVGLLNDEGAARRVVVRLQLTRYHEPPGADLCGGAADTGALRVLVVDDNLVQTRLLHKLCTVMGARVDCAHDGTDAVHMAEKARYDVVFMDLIMPTMGGVEATRRIIRLDPRTRVYGMSANAFQSDFDELLQAGAVRCDTKPVGREVVREIMQDEMLRKQNRRKTL